MRRGPFGCCCLRSAEHGTVESEAFHGVLMDSRNGGEENEPFAVEGGLTVALDLSLVNNLSPSFVHAASEKAATTTSPTSSSAGAAAAAPSVADAAFPETSVRYFLRLVVWTDPEDKVRPACHTLAQPCPA